MPLLLGGITYLLFGGGFYVYLLLTAQVMPEEIEEAMEASEPYRQPVGAAVSRASRPFAA